MLRDTEQAIVDGKVLAMITINRLESCHHSTAHCGRSVLSRMEFYALQSSSLSPTI